MLLIPKSPILWLIVVKLNRRLTGNAADCYLATPNGARFVRNRCNALRAKRSVEDVVLSLVCGRLLINSRHSQTTSLAARFFVIYSQLEDIL